MNYLVTSDAFFGDAPGGGVRIAWELARLARDQGHQVALLCASTPTGPPPGSATIEDIKVVRFGLPKLARLNPFRFAHYVRAAQAAAKQGLGHLRWDVVHAHMIGSGLAAFRQCGGRALRVCTIHSPAILEQAINWSDGTLSGKLKLAAGIPLLWAQERSFYRAAHRLSALSLYTRGEIARLFGRRVATKIRCIPWWRDPTQFRSTSREEARRLLGWPQSIRILFTLRRLVPRMGLDTLLAAMQGLEGLQAALYIAGDGPERERLAKLATRAPGSIQISFLGSISDQDAALAYQAADLFVLPTRTLECFGIIGLEALSFGCPVMGSRAGAIPEMLSPILPDWLFDPGDAAGLALRLRAFLEDKLVPPSPEKLAAYADERYGKARVSADYLRLIDPGDRAASIH
jgi:glycosyltransferase involved in cell wall biosynthesis